MSLRMEVARLGKAVKASQARAESLEGQLAASRDWERVVEGTLRPQERAAGEATLRAQARPAARSRRPARNGPGSRSAPKSTTRPPMRACVPVPYVANGERSSTVIEIEVKAHTRRIVRPRWRRNSASRPWKCRRPRWRGCSPTRPISFWARFLFEHCACLRPLTALPRGCPTRGWRSRPGRWPTL